MRLIDADALRTAMFSYYPCVNEHSVKHNYSGDTLMDYEVADLIDDCIDNAIAIDAVEVVRCKECVNYNTACCAAGFGWCEHMDCGVMDEHFCSYGERRNPNDHP